MAPAPAMREDARDVWLQPAEEEVQLVMERLKVDFRRGTPSPVEGSPTRMACMPHR